MKSSLFVLMASLSLVAGAATPKSATPPEMPKTSTPKGWTDDFVAAKRQAAKEKKFILADFSGSDWCGWCMRLDKEVFATEEFMSAATNKFVLLMIDSPNDKTRLSKKAAEQNPGLVRQYGIRGFPTVLIMDRRGEVLYRTGYHAGGPVAYLKDLEDSLAAQMGPRVKKQPAKPNAKR